MAKNSNSKDILIKETLEKFKEVAKPIIEKLQEITAKFKNNWVAIITHSNADPDAIAAALVVKKYLKKHSVVAEIFADGESFFREAKVIINKIGIEIKSLEEFDKIKHRQIILIDATPNQANIPIKNIKPDLVIDHHDDEAPYESTATIVTLLMTVLEFELVPELATALYIGLETDTAGFTANKFTEFDELALKILTPLIDVKLRKEIIQCGYSLEYLRMLENAISESKFFYQRGSTVISGVGYIGATQKVYLAKIADFLLNLDVADKVIILAIVDGERIVPSIRSSTGTENARELSKKVFGENVAGGDPVKASGEVGLGTTMIQLIEQAKASGDEKALERYFGDILNLYRKKILEEQTK